MNFQMMNTYFFRLMCLFLFVGLLGACKPKSAKRILVFSKTAGFRHTSIPAGKAALLKLGLENKIQVDTTENSADFNEANLKKYAAVVFLNTTGDILNSYQQADFERFIQAGGGFVGIHAATDTEYDWPWYNQLVGAYFNGHPKIQKAKLLVNNKTHIATKMLPSVWERRDEWYNFKSFNAEVNVLLDIDENSYEGGTMANKHPMSWYHEYDGGRAFYTALGHTEETYEEPLFLQHLLGGLQYAMGTKAKDYAAVSTKRVPPENRFVRKVLWRNLNEPMELDVFDNGQIIVVERKGRILLWDTKMQILEPVANIEVHTKYEDGLLGVAIDPDYANNKWVYFFYSPPGEEPKQHVSRFVFEDGKLDRSSEKVLLEIAVQRDQCCHSGGSLEFGPQGNLFITVGDNTNPFASNGFSPSDEREGRQPWDAQGSSANTNDLRGKILRIRPEDDGTYSIPEGNLFPVGTPKTRPEIYVMGCRNPFRHAIDHRTGNLFWGDVGPDSGKDKEDRGPKGIDEVNIAKGPGNWGWPYSRGNNQAYHRYNFETKASGPFFDPDNPINESPNNTGLRELPPANKSLIWYSYDESKEFPWVGVGGKNPMAGPIYYSDQFSDAKRFPDYFDGKLLIYEWMRNWIYVVKMDSTGQMLRVDPFMANESFSRPMDMVFGPDGALYVLEYGQKWFSANLDARLNKIEFVRGNRVPIPKIEVDQSVGAAPLAVRCSAKSSYDFDEGDELKFAWKINGEEVSQKPEPTLSFKEAGIHQLELVVTDLEGYSAVAKQEIQVGNAPPQISIALKGGNRSFYDDRKKQMAYEVSVADGEDGTTDEGLIAADAVSVSLDYVETGFDMTSIAQGHQTNTSGGNLADGKKLIEGSDCKTCHAAKVEVNGPSYNAIAARYNNSPSLVTTLAKKVIRGGQGTWGERAMSAHPQIKQDDAEEMVRYILSLGQKDVAAAANRMPLKGDIKIDEAPADANNGSYVLMVSYTDKGHQKIKPITSRKTFTIRSPKVEAENYDAASFEVKRVKKGEKRDFNGVGRLRHDSFLRFDKLDLEGVGSLLVRGSNKNTSKISGRLEVRLDGPDGKKVGEAAFEPNEFTNDVELNIPLEPTKGMHDLFFVVKTNAPANQAMLELDWIYFDISGKGEQRAGL
ncbi:MAG: ThuA domain-containing protein [Bacteroidota bacterium]